MPPSLGRTKSRHLRVCYTLFPPYVVDPRPPSPLGLDPDLVRALSKHLKIDVTFVPSKDFNELIILLLMGQADMSISQLNLVHPRYALGLDVSPILTQRSMVFVTRHPVAIDSLSTMTDPFSVIIWVWILISIILVTATLALFNKYVKGQMLYRKSTNICIDFLL